MGVASHLGIKLTEYDSRIRTFIPHYEEMLGVAAAAIPPRARTIVELRPSASDAISDASTSCRDLSCNRIAARWVLA